MRVLDKKINRTDLLKNADFAYDDEMIKGVVDVEKQLLAIDGEMHADLEQLLLSQGSSQDFLWGINLYPEDEDDFIEFDSMINIRPRQNNRSRSVEDENIKKQIISVVKKWIS